MKIPIRYIFALSHIINSTETKRKAEERAISHPGTPNGILDIMTIGEVNGIIEAQNASVDVGSLITVIARSNPIMIGIVAKEVSWLAS